MKKVTAVLPVRNCRRELGRCLSALQRSSYIPDIIVVDDASGDGTRQMIKEHWPGVTYLSLSAHTGYAHAANAGLRLVRTQYAFLIRPDLGLRVGRKCIAGLLQAMDDEEAFCAVPKYLPAGKGGHAVRAGYPGTRGRGRGEERIFFPGTAGGGRKKQSAPEVIAVQDGCAMYRMRALEEVGWLDERHFDGLEAFDLSLRAALAGWKTVKAPGAYVQTPAQQTGEEAQGSAGGTTTFRRQLAAGNSLYVFYKNIPAPMRILGFPLFAAADIAQAASFVCRGEFGAYRMALERGRALCGLEKDRRAALDGGAGIWPENLSDASFLGMDEAAEHIYPLFLAEKEPLSLRRLSRCLHVQKMAAAEMPGMIRLLV